jgi:hypothetical protein
MADAPFDLCATASLPWFDNGTCYHSYGGIEYFELFYLKFSAINALC